MNLCAKLKPLLAAACIGRGVGRDADLAARPHARTLLRLRARHPRHGGGPGRALSSRCAIGRASRTVVPMVPPGTSRLPPIGTLTPPAAAVTYSSVMRWTLKMLP